MRRFVLAAVAVCAVGLFAEDSRAEEQSPFKLLGTAATTDSSSASVAVTPASWGCGYGYRPYTSYYSYYRPYYNYGYYGSYYRGYPYSAYYGSPYSYYSGFPYGGGYYGGGYYPYYGGYYRGYYGPGIGFSFGY